MSTLEEKLFQLKQTYTKEKDLKRISNTEKKLREALIKSEILSDPIITEVVDQAYKDIEIIDLVLANDPELVKQENEVERMLLFKEKEWIMKYVINRLSSDNQERIIDRIEKSIDSVLKRGEKYQVLN